MKLITKAATVALLTMTFAQASWALTTDEARDIVEPFYSFLSQPTNVEAANTARDSFHSDWQSYYSNQGTKGLDGTIKFLSGFGELVPDLKWEIVDLKVSGNDVIVRGEATGTPVGDFFGVPHGGKSFKIMSIDIHTINDGKVQRSYHIEDWAGAMRQLSN